jgi:hypothetical protein
MAAGYSSAAVTMGHLALKRAIRHTEANDLVSRNVATLADTPKGQDGRPSKSLTSCREQSAAGETGSGGSTAARLEEPTDISGCADLKGMRQFLPQAMKPSMPGSGKLSRVFQSHPGGQHVPGAPLIK